ncbi:epimerase family protein SDR39U1 isoform X2 [Anabrus simplex]
MPGPQRLSWADIECSGIPENTTAVVNLAGQNILDPSRRWTPGFKQNVRSSRINTTCALAQAIIRTTQRPKVFVSISGVGIYEPSKTAEYTEDCRGGNFDFLSDLAQEWEQAARLPSHIGVRQVIIRSGVVLGRSGGMIKQVYWPFYLGVGGPVGSGDQFFPWIHLHDLVRLIVFAIENNEVKGVLNGVAPQVVTNKDFALSFGKAMWRPAFIPVPEFALNVAFGDERAKIMTEGQKVVPKRVLQYGFEYRYPDIDSACRECARMSTKEQPVIM